MRKTAHIIAVVGALLWASHATANSDASGEEGTEPRGSAQLTLDDLRTFTDVFNQVRRNYVEEVDDHTLLDSAIRGMLLELDPHSRYFPSSDYQDFEDSSQGRYVGVGIDVHAFEGRIVVKAVITESPADEAGINPGDVITAIDGVSVEGRHLPDAIDELMGEPGSEVELEILTPAGEQRRLDLQRRYLDIPVLSFGLLEQDWGYFKISMFHSDSARDFEQSLASIAADGIELRGLVIDLRGNPGGVLQGAVELADGFLDDGLIVTTRGRNSTMQMEFAAHPGQWLTGVPLLLLVDRGSASASEVLAGALQDHRRAVIVGERTFGKGSVQSVLPLRNGGGIKLTTARYYTPSGRSIQAQGIEPDIVYESGGTGEADPHRQREADLDRHLDQETGPPAGPADARRAVDAEFPLEEALKILEMEGIVVTDRPASSESDSAAEE